jgi:Protein of unknown function (DUF3072)
VNFLVQHDLGRKAIWEHNAKHPRCRAMTNPNSNTQKDPDDWVSGDEPMTGAQASYLKALSEQAHEPAAFHERLTKAQASQEIDRLREKIGLQTPDD